MAELSVSVAALSSAAADLRGVADQSRLGLNSLDGELSDLLGAGWVGAAGSAFGTVWQEWHEGAAKVLHGLDAMAAALDVAAQNYSATDSAEAAAVDSAGL